MRSPATALMARALAVAAILASGAAGRAEDASTRLRHDPSRTFQTWEAWGCMPNPAGYERAFVAWLRSPTPETFDRVPMARDLPDRLVARMHDALVGEMGITRVRVEVGPQVEPVNDDDDPTNEVASAFRWRWQDDQIERHVLPLARRVSAAGGRLVVYVSFDLRSKLTPPFLLRPEEYAEMAVAFLRHVKAKHGLEPDYWSVLTEPGNDRPGDPRLCAELTAATGKRIAAAGFRTRMSGPECVTVAQAAAYMDAMERVPGALERFAQVTYHLYHGGAEDVAARRAVRERAKRLGVTAAQTEWMEARDVDVARHVLLCLTEADAVTWERYGADLFFGVPYETWTDPASAAREDLPLSTTAWHLRQFSRWIRPGMVRVALEGGDATLGAVAFAAKPGERPVVVLVHSARGAARTVALEGLPAGAYDGAFTARPSGALGRALERREVGADGRLALTLPAASVTTLFPAPEPAGEGK